MPPFKVEADFSPSGDQPDAIRGLAESVLAGNRFTTLLGATGTGKTATLAWSLEQIQKPTLVIAPNKSLAAQLCNEFKQFFPSNAVEYFVSYYDYYQPEAYVPSSDTYIEKDSSVNEEIERLRHSATSALQQRDDVLIVASVSCIFGLGSPEEYLKQVVDVARGGTADRDFILAKLVDIQYERNDLNFVRGKFRVRGDTIEVFPAYEEKAIRIELFGDEVDRIVLLDTLTGEITGELDHVTIYPGSHYVASRERMGAAIQAIEQELAEQLDMLQQKSKLLEAQRLRMRTEYDLEMLREVGFCNGIENYARHIEGRPVGSRPSTLIDYFPDDLLIVVDESHVGVPQLGGMYEGDMSRKRTLVEHGFRLPSALDNRPLRFDEFLDRVEQVVMMSATPGPFERQRSDATVEQIVRPTGLIDPEVLIRPTRGQIDDLLDEIKKRTDVSQRVLVTTLTKKMAENLTDYLLTSGIRVRYLHSDIGAVERIEILRDLRLGEFDVLVGINLLREGLDLPEVSLVAILDADKEGYLRSQTSLIQTIGRAARNVDGQVIMYADEVTDSMRRAISETQRRRQIQLEYNQEHGIDPQSIRKAVTDILIEGMGRRRTDATVPVASKSRRSEPFGGSPDELQRLLLQLSEEMHQAAQDLRFEYAARLRDEIKEL
ncbi:MAG: excinuclease ABC subunit UvrB, partial [Actinobacteria bacterium]|nr:excinuclease ABC subunit UvrB [Actinomycetota bacterium]